MKILDLNGTKIRPVVVVVSEKEERTNFILKELATRGIYPDVFNGFSSDLSGLVTKHTYELDNPGGGHLIGPKCVSTWISFYAMWSALNMLDDQFFLTMEWDAKFDKDWIPKTIDALKHAPKDFDMLLLGSCCTSKKPMTHIGGNVWNVRWPLCGHATIIAKKCIPKLLATQRKVYAPLDISLVLHTFEQAKLGVYTVLPRIVDQFDTFLPP